MIEVLKAIWAFLVALGPFLTALAGVLVEATAALIELAKITVLVTVLVGAVEILFDPRGKQRVGNLLYNIVTGAIGIAVTALNDSTPALQAVVNAFVSAFQGTGPTLAKSVGEPIGNLAESTFNAASQTLLNTGPSAPETAVATAAAAFKQAYGFGISSAAVTAAFESLFPERLNTLNGVGPAFANMAGFEEISGSVLEPLYRNAFGRSLEYFYRGQFKPDYPSEGDAVTWHARGLLTDAQLREIFNVSGLKSEYESAYIASAYRPIPPFLVTRAAETGAISTDGVKAIFQFAGYRPQDVATLLQAYEALALLPYQTAYLTAAERSTELGVMTPDELTQEMNQLGIPQDAQALIQLTIATRKLEQLAELYRKSVSESYKYGLITDQQYVPALESIGIGYADAQAHYAVDSIAKQGKAAMAALKAEQRLLQQQLRAGQQAAIANYRTGATDAAALEAELLGLGLDPTIVGFIVSMQQARLEGVQVHLYGVTLSRDKAILLREQVSALGIQVRAGLQTPEQALTALAGYGIPAANAEALVADWAATKVAASEIGVLLPR